MNITPLNTGGTITTLYQNPAVGTSTVSDPAVSQTATKAGPYLANSVDDSVEISAEASALNSLIESEGSHPTDSEEDGGSVTTASLSAESGPHLPLPPPEPLDMDPYPKPDSGDGGN